MTPTRITGNLKKIRLAPRSLAARRSATAWTRNATGFEFCAASIQMRGREAVDLDGKGDHAKVEWVGQVAYALGSHSCNPFSAE
jgi:hypothetical protein